MSSLGTYNDNLSDREKKRGGGGGGGIGRQVNVTDEGPYRMGYSKKIVLNRKGGG